MPTANIQVATLQEQFSSAWRFLKNTRIDRPDGFTSLTELPWYLVIGSTQAGKTELIVQSNFNFIEAPHLNTHPNDESEDDHRCNWWFTRHMTFIDVPGHYLCQEDSQSDWQTFLTILRPYLARKPLNGIILTLDLVELGLFSKTGQKKYIQQLRESLFLLSKQFSTTCPLYLLLGKVDRVTGFAEFFADLGKEEREQICGINLAQTPQAETISLPRLFKRQFGILIKRLQGRVIWRLHHERNANKRALITQFPLQLESFGNNLANILYHLTDIIGLTEKLPLQGIYFVSSLQNGLSIDCLHKTTSQDLILPNNISTLPTTHKQRTYFSRQLFHNMMANTATLKQAYQHFSLRDKMRLSSYILAVIVITGSGLLMANNFNQRVAKLNAAQTALAKYNVLEQQLSPQNSDLGQTLPALNTLRQATQLIAQTQLSWLSVQARKLSPLASKTYHTSLTTYFLPNLNTMLEHALNNSTAPAFNYGALKVYLMLGDPRHLDPKFVALWFAHYWQQLFANNLALQQQLNAHLAALLTEPFKPQQLNQNLVIKTRNLLANTPAPELTYAIVKAQLNTHLINPISKNPEQTAIFNQVFQNSNGNLNINSIYTNKQFADIYLNRILTVSVSLARGDWVLGASTRANLTTHDLSILVEQTRDLYLKDYAAQWQMLLNNTQLIPWQTGTQIQLVLENLLGRQSPLIHIIKAVNDNTNLQVLTQHSADFTKQDLQAIDTNLSSQFANLKAFSQSLAGTKPSGFSQVIDQLKNLQDLLLSTTKNNAASKDLFLMAKAHFKNSATNHSDPITQLAFLANSAPAPLQSWLNQMASNSWKLVLNNTAQYINAQWQQQIIPFYQTNLIGRYPLTKSASTDIPLNSFKYFFGNHGLLTNFFNQYLSPFIDTSHAQWQWQSLDGQTLKLATNVLPQLERAAIIRTMFFTNNDELKVPFNLKLVSFEPGITRFSLKLGDKIISDQIDQTTEHAFVWPINNSSNEVSLTFADHLNRSFTTTIQGPWAFFRLLGKSNLQQMDNTERYNLTLDYDGNAVRYQLSTNHIINPFISGIMEQFQCPAALQ